MGRHLQPADTFSGIPNWMGTAEKWGHSKKFSGAKTSAPPLSICFRRLWPSQNSLARFEGPLRGGGKRGAREQREGWRKGRKGTGREGGIPEINFLLRPYAPEKHLLGLWISFLAKQQYYLWLYNISFYLFFKQGPRGRLITMCMHKSNKISKLHKIATKK